MPPKKAAKQVVQPPKEQLPPPIPQHQLRGYGRFEYIDGATYQGQWHLFDNIKMKHGQGKLKVPITKGCIIQQQYTGSWQKDQMSGYGVYKYPTGAVYQGSFKNNKFQGQGKYTFPDGTIYKGSFSNGLFDGPGIYISAAGRGYQGQFRSGSYIASKQKQLVTQRRRINYIKQVTNDVTQLLKNMAQILSKTQKKTLKQNIAPFLPSGQIIKTLVKDAVIKPDQRTVDKWNQVLSVLRNQNSRIVALKSNEQSTILPIQRILGKQLQGPGQIVQVHSIIGQRNIRAAFVNVQQKHWSLCLVLDDQKKK